MSQSEKAKGVDVARFEDLEIRFAQIEKVIADLNDVVTAQWRRIDALESQIRRLRDEVETLDQGPKGPEPKPPHY